MKIPHWLSITASFVLVGFLVALFFVSHPFLNQTNMPSFTHPLTIGAASISAAYATTAVEQELGLSNSAELTDQEGMLFIFNNSQPLSFWMKDMNYPLDIIWIGADKSVMEITKNLDPKTYPETFSPQSPAQYALEVRSGFADAHAVVVGTKVSF